MSFAGCVKGLMEKILVHQHLMAQAKKTYLLTKAVENVQLIPTPTIRCTRTLVLFVSLVW
jgi:hypothetical protein